MEMYGAFSEGLLHGKGTLKLIEDDYEYTGAWKRGNKQGKGK